MIYKKIVLKPGQQVFFMSDPHYGHRNICRGTTQWELRDHGGDNAVRDFDTLEHMNDTIVNGINNMVGQDDWLVCLGDWSFGGEENILKFRNRIICKNLIHILGNHDHHICRSKDIQGYFGYNVYAYLELTVTGMFGKNTYNLFHFPIHIWNKAHHDRVHLYGHVHGGYTAPDRSLDVGIDNAFKLYGEYRPFSEGDIAKYMKNRHYHQQSHHSKDTN